MKTKVEIIKEQFDKFLKNYSLSDFHCDFVTSNHDDNHTSFQWFITTDTGYFDVFDINALLKFADTLHLSPSFTYYNGQVALELYLFI